MFLGFFSKSRSSSLSPPLSLALSLSPSLCLSPAFSLCLPLSLFYNDFSLFFLCFVVRCKWRTSKDSPSLLSCIPSFSPSLPLSVLLGCLLSSSGPHMGFIPPYCNPAQNYFLFQFPGEVVKWFLNQTSPFFSLSLFSFSATFHTATQTGPTISPLLFSMQ